ncbi:hypothetical protein D1097_09105 [Actinobacillus pleuropneumoniae serovar 4 str. M62]|nr:hypothetical protein D1097_09105 [Actinobacillus pleuropneumoniae serovar 4 str. M62]
MREWCWSNLKYIFFKGNKHPIWLDAFFYGLNFFESIFMDNLINTLLTGGIVIALYKITISFFNKNVTEERIK